jgi:hypothetical protein
LQAAHQEGAGNGFMAQQRVLARPVFAFHHRAITVNDLLALLSAVGGAANLHQHFQITSFPDFKFGRHFFPEGCTGFAQGSRSHGRWVIVQFTVGKFGFLLHMFFLSVVFLVSTFVELPAGVRSAFKISETLPPPGRCCPARQM